MVSAVPAGDVIEREEVFGIVRPAAAIIGTTSIVVLFPGIPPIQCLSTMISLGLTLKSSCFPTATIAFVSPIVSFSSSLFMVHARTK